MKLSLVLPVYNAPDDVRVCLESLDAGLSGADCDLTVINDASGEETSALLREFAGSRKSAPYAPRLVEHEANLGYLRTANEGLAGTTGDVAILLNSDTAVPAGFARRVEACFAADPLIGIASPVGSHCGLFSIPMKPGWTGKDVDSMDVFLKDAPPLYPTVILPDGFCFCVRKAVLDQVGLFDERYGPGYFEEYDLGMRARRMGWKTVLIDNLYVYHKAQVSFGTRKNREHVRRNEALFRELWGDAFHALRAAHPREEHKPRLYRLIYSPAERMVRKTLRFLALAIPFAETRRRIRRAYN